jgi:RNA polymerase sigma-70 factor (ECF subfamily)
MMWLARAAQGEALGRYHVEAGIAVEHCVAPSFVETRWDRIADRYAMLERIDPSPLHTLNRAVATAEASGPEAGLALLRGLEPPAWLEGSYLWAAAQADLHRRAGDADRAEAHRQRAIAAAPTAQVRELLERRLAIAPPSSAPPGRDC